MTAEEARLPELEWTYLGWNHINKRGLFDAICDRYERTKDHSVYVLAFRVPSWVAEVMTCDWWISRPTALTLGFDYYENGISIFNWILDNDDRQRAMHAMWRSGVALANAIYAVTRDMPRPPG